MALLRTLCWALIFILRLRFPPGSSLACKYNVSLFTIQPLQSNLNEFTGYGIYIYKTMV